MLLQITESGLPCHGKPACKCLYRTCQKWNFVLAHINSLQLLAAKVQQKNDIRKFVCHFSEFSWFCLPALDMPAKFTKRGRG